MTGQIFLKLTRETHCCTGTQNNFFNLHRPNCLYTLSYLLSAFPAVSIVKVFNTHKSLHMFRSKKKPAYKWHAYVSPDAVCQAPTPSVQVLFKSEAVVTAVQGSSKSKTLHPEASQQLKGTTAAPKAPRRAGQASYPGLLFGCSRLVSGQV